MKLTTCYICDSECKDFEGNWKNLCASCTNKVHIEYCGFPYQGISHYPMGVGLGGYYLPSIEIVKAKYNGKGTLPIKANIKRVYIGTCPCGINLQDCTYHK